MKKIKLSVVVTAMALFLIASLASADESAVLESLETIKANIEQGVDYQSYAELITNCKVKVNIYNRGKNKNKCFAKNIQICFNAYEEAGRRMESKLLNKLAIQRAGVIPSSTPNSELQKGIYDSLYKINLSIEQDTIAMQKAWVEGNTYLEKAYSCL